MPTMPSIPSLPSARRMKLWTGKGDKSGPNSPEEEKENRLPTSTLSQEAKPALTLRNDKDEDGRPLAKEIQSRKVAVDRLYISAEAFHSSLVKRKVLPFEMTQQVALETAMTLDEAATTSILTYPASSELVAQAAGEGSTNLTRNKDKLLPLEAFGIGMASAAPAYSRTGQDETKAERTALSKNEHYASHLAHLAGMHLALGEAQSTFAEQLSSTLLSRLARTQAAIESLRLAEKTCHQAYERMDQAEKKRDKVRDKGESKRELEEDARLARATYEDAQADLEKRVQILADAERTGPQAGVEVVKGYVALYNDWINKQQLIVSSVQRALQQFKDSPPTSGSVRNTFVRPAPALPKRFDVAADEGGMVAVGNAEHRSTSTTNSPRHAQKPLVPARMSRSGSVKTTTSRPPSRGSVQSKTAVAANEKGKLERRSDSFSSGVDGKVLNSSSSNGSANNQGGHGRGHSGSIGSKLSGKLTSVLMRSTSSNEVPKSSLNASSVSVQQHESGSSNESKSSGWPSSLLPALKREQNSRSLYKTMDAADTEAIIDSPPQSQKQKRQHERDLSHVREGTDEIAAGISFTSSTDGRDPITMHETTHDSLGLGPAVHHASLADENDVFAYREPGARQPSDHIITYTSALHSPNGTKDDLLSATSPTYHTHLSPSAYSTGLGAQWTGMTSASSDGGDPFGGGTSNDQEALWSNNPSKSSNNQRKGRDVFDDYIRA